MRTVHGKQKRFLKILFEKRQREIIVIKVERASEREKEKDKERDKGRGR